VAATTAGSAAAVVVAYIGLALQLSAFVIVLAVLALVLFDSPSPPPPVLAGVFAVLPPALLPMAPATDWTAWICSTIAIGVALLFHYLRKPRGTSSRRRGPKRAPPTARTPELGPCRVKDSNGVCGVNHLHAHCPKRAANRAAAAATKWSRNLMASISCPGPGHSPVSCKPPLGPDPAGAYGPMMDPLVHYHYACFYCREFFSYPGFASPVCTACRYGGCNAALLVQAEDVAIQAGAAGRGWKITVVACGSNFVSDSYVDRCSRLRSEGAGLPFDATDQASLSMLLICGPRLVAELCCSNCPSHHQVRCL
jgi:hypothetical protein